MRIILGLLMLLAMAPAAPVMAAGDYLADAGARDSGMAALDSRLGTGRPLIGMRFEANRISVTGQADSGSQPAAWSVGRFDLGFANFHWVSGPDRAVAPGIVDDLSGAYFRREEIDVGGLRPAVAAAVAYAQLESIPQVQWVEIARNVSILPAPAYGAIRWTVRLEAVNESATVYLDNAGAVIGGDLSDTERARKLNLLRSDDWPMAEAQAAFAAVLGNSRVHRVAIYDSYVFLTADHPTDPGLQRDYSWYISGLRQGIIDTPNLVTLGLGDMASFALGEIDLTRLPEVKANALAAFDMAGSQIIAIGANKPTSRAASDIKVLWQVQLREPDGAEGRVWLDAAGEVVEVRLPESRLPEPGPWLAPETVIDTLARIETTFGSDAKVFEISINDRHASIEIEDPQAPGKIARFLMDAREVRRFGTGSFFSSLAPDAVFTPADLAGLSVGQLAEMTERTVSRLEMERGEVFRYTFSRHALILDPSDTRLMIEIRYGDPSGDAGWMTFLTDGTQTDELIP